MTEKYSVLISVYEKEKPERFTAALLSMINQTAAPDEIVIVKDGPLGDGLDMIVDAFVSEYEGLFTVLENEENLGLGPSLNKGVSACRNELIARMDSDDVSRKDRIEKQLKMFEDDPELSVCGGVIREFYDDDPDDTAGYRVCPETDEEIREYLKTRCPLNHMTVMYKKSEVLKAGNYQDLHYNEDYLLWIRMFEAGCKFANLQEVLVDVRVGKDMYSRRGGDAYFESEKAIQDILLQDGIINQTLYNRNMLKRKIVEKWMPAGVRGLVFKIAARRSSFDEEA
ncbi:MAG: glycosyltransferase [Solobacterium sp.]|nr:glycosyltransferase [Solobacterium sp.]